MTIFIDILAVIGGILVVAGVYLWLGLAAALIAGGSLIISFALKAAKVAGELNVSDSA